MKLATHNFPNIKEHGDVFEADFTQYKGVDYLIGGSPCTYWSIAQKNYRETTASGLGWDLFCQYVRAIKEAQPKWFLYENNKSMSATIRESISKKFGFEPICINSALVSAQNRKRLYWCGKRNNDGTYSKVDILQPEDKGILLRDILETNGQRVPQYGEHNKSKPCEAMFASHAGTGAGSFKKSLFNDNPNKQRVNMTAKPVRVGALPRPNGELSTSQGMRIYSINGKSVNLTSSGGGLGGKTGLYAVPITKTKDGKSYAITANYRFMNVYPNDYAAHSIEKSVKPVVAEQYIGQVTPSKIYEVKGGLITIKDKQYPTKLADGYYIIRKLSVNECKRLQTVPDWYDMSAISDSQAYKCLGNGWTVDIIAHILSFMR